MRSRNIRHNGRRWRAGGEWDPSIGLRKVIDVEFYETSRLTFDAAVAKVEKAKSSKKDKEKKEAEEEYEVAKSR